MKHHDLKQLTLMATLALVIAYAIGFLMLKGAGLRHAFFYTMPLVLLYALCSGSKRIFWFFLFPFTLIYALYAPIGFTYGKLSYDFFIAGISTDMIEIKEFVQLIPLRNFFIPILILILLFLFWKIVRRYQIHYYRNKTFLFISLLIITIGQSPMIFLQQIREGSTAYYKEQQALNNLVEANEWGESLLTASEYDTYILIIGESAHKGYLHAYGYPINTTPFMSSTNGFLIDGLMAGGTSTIPSLKAMLTYPDKATWDADYTKTIVGLAQSAGIKTYWLSNQGYFGTFDTPISAIATSSDEKKFMKFGDYGTANTSDFELLKYLEEIVEKSPHEKKLIIVHLYGSHANACQRIDDYALIHEVKDSRYDYINCYIASIHKTDTLLREINDFMNQISQKEASSYSLLYFSDHGQTLYENDGQYFLGNRGGYHQYEIPLFMTASDIDKRTECKSFKSGLNFTNGLANWMGIQNPLLDKQYSLFNCQDDPDDYGLSKKLEGLHKDEVIELEGK